MCHRFRKAEHIRKRADYERVYDDGLKVSGRYMLVFLRRSAGPTARLGIAATRKIGGAVIRNRARRRVRELFRRLELQGAIDVVVVPRRELANAPFTRLEAEFRAIVGRPVPERGGPRRARRHSRV